MINIKDLHKQFDQLKVLKGINLEVKTGQVVVVIGPSGSGKNNLAAVHKCAGAAYFRTACHWRSSPRLFSAGLEKANSSLQAPYRNGFSEL